MKRPYDQIMATLKNAGHPLARPEIAACLEEEYADRSLRRWLAELVDLGRIQRTGKGRDTHYSLQVEEEYASSIFSESSQESLRKSQRPLELKVPKGYDASWVESYHPNQDFYLPLSVRKQLAKIGSRLSEDCPAGTFAHKIYNHLLINLSYNSSRLEGNTYSLLETKNLIFSGTSASDKLDEEKAMILNHKEAIRYLVKSASQQDMSDHTVLTLHYLLSDGLIDPAYSGRVRDFAVRVSGTSYLPSANADFLRSHLSKIVKLASAIEDPFEQSFFLLVHISYLQAFADVNKRTARLCCNIPLVKRNLVPLSFNDISVENYISSMLAVYELHDVKPLIDLYLYSYKRSALEYDVTVEAFGFDLIRVRYRQLRRELSAKVIREKLSMEEAKSVAAAKAKLEIPKEHQEGFILSLIEDLKLMDKYRLVGLGVTEQEFLDWQARL